MNVGQFIERFRRDRKDEAQPYLWSDAEIADDFLNDAVEEACQRAHRIGHFHGAVEELAEEGGGIGDHQRLDARGINVTGVTVSGGGRWSFSSQSCTVFAILRPNPAMSQRTEESAG